jgi:hypothetical protein
MAGVHLAEQGLPASAHPYPGDAERCGRFSRGCRQIAGVPRRRPDPLRALVWAAAISAALVVGLTVVTAKADDLPIVGLAALTVLFALIAAAPRTMDKSERQLDAAQLRSEQHLARIAELLEQQQNAATAAVPAPPRRRPSSRIVALVLLALVVARLGSWYDWEVKHPVRK